MSNAVIKALCNPVRLNIICCLDYYKGKTVKELITVCGLSQSAVSQHLLKLKKAGIVTSQKNGRLVIYSLTNKKFLKASKLILNLSKEKII